MRVLMTADAVGGVWQYCVDLLKSLAHHNVEVVLATLGPRPSAEQKRQLCEISQLTLVESDFPLEWMRGASEMLEESGRWLLELQKHFRADLVHLNGYSHASLPWGRPVLVTAHSCVFSWWNAVHGGAPATEGSDWYKAAVTQGLGAATTIVAPSLEMARNLIREYGVSGITAKVIYNFSRVPIGRSRNRRACCLAAGRIWDAAKNLAMLDTIAARLKWPIQIAGDDSGPLQSPQPLRYVNLLGVMTHAELLNSLRSAGMFLHPALYEPFGLTVLEAARSGCCLVLADIPSLRELWQNHALFVDARDPDHWVYEINKLVDDEGRRRRLADSAQAHSRRYSADHSVAEYLNVYQDLAMKDRRDLADGAAA